MTDQDPRSSGSTATIVILIALLVLTVPCCAGVALFGLGAWSFRAMPQPVPPPIVQPMPQLELEAQPDVPPPQTAPEVHDSRSVAPAETSSSVSP